MTFDDFINKQESYNFYGVCMNEFKLNNVVWEAIEDPSDGYRSYMESVEVSTSEGIFFNEPLAEIKVEPITDGYTDGYQVVDIDDGHVWLKFGTSNYDDYYPYFIFKYEPKTV